MSFGCLRYWTKNIGDEIQSLAAMNYLPSVDVTFDRDNTFAGAPQDECFVICNGWWMHTRGNRFQFPLAPHIQPLFVSVHLRKWFRERMSDEMFAYLRTHAPIGCRDEDTLRFLESKGVPAYFTGCLTSTLGLFQDDHSSRDGPVCIVDVPKWAAELIPKAIRKQALWFFHALARSQAPHYNAEANHAERLFQAQRLLEHYRRATLVITGRLHCALPALAVGTPVVFVPESARDARYGAIAGLTPIYQAGDKIDWNPSPVDIRERAIPLSHLVREAVELRSNPMRGERRFPQDFQTPPSSSVKLTPADADTASKRVSAGTEGLGTLPAVEKGTFTEPVPGPAEAVECFPKASEGSRTMSFNVEKLTVLFLNLDMKRVRTGIENAALLRAKAFESKLGIVPRLLTINYDAHFAETRAELVRAGKVTENTMFRNMYDSFQGLHEVDRRVGHGSVPVNEDWRCVDVPNTPDQRIYGQGNECLMYKKCSRHTGTLEYINFFHKQRMWRRDTFTPDGVLSRIQYLDREAREAIFEHYLRPDGSVAIIQLYTREDGERTLSKISLMSREGVCVEEFASQQDFIAHWLDRLTSDVERRYLLVSDKNRYYYQPLRTLKSLPGKDNVFVVPIIHAVHTKDGFDIQRSRTNRNYADILEDIDAPDAIVVATSKQRQDIVDRYGSGNIHVIPHAYSQSDEPVGVEFRDRDRTKAIYLGRYSEEKNHALAVRAFAKVVAAVPEATLHMYGSGSGKAGVEELVKQLGLERSIFVNDYATDVSSIYRTAGLSLLTSKGEGYPLVIMESLCHGCPVIAFDVNYGPSDMIRDGETGILVPFGDVELFARKLIELLRKPELHEQMCENALQASRAFSADVVAEGWAQLIGRIMSWSGVP